MQFAHSIAHYFYPRHSNNHRAKLIHTSSILYLALLLVVFQAVLNFLPIKNGQTLGFAANISPQEVIRITNEKRALAGLGALRYNAALTQAANAKARHMIDKDYWAHVAPDGTEPWKFFTDVGYRYRYAGENLARDFSNPSAVVDAWMASPSHKENLMSSKYVDIGIGVTEGDLSGSDTTIVVQLFGTPLSGETQTVTAQAKTPATATPIPTRRPTATLVPTAAATPVPTLEPTLAPTAIPITIAPTDIPGGQILTTLPSNQKEANRFNVLISPFQSTRGISALVTGILIIVFLIDGVVVLRRRLTRNHGRTLAHLTFLGAILIIILISKAGVIL